MELSTSYNEMRKHARITGILYLIIIVSGLFSELFVRSGIIVDGDVATTANNIQTNESLFRLGFVSDLIMVMSDVGVALLFYLLLKHVSNGLSLLAAFFRLAQATVLGINLLNFYMPLILINNSQILSAFSPEQINSLIMLFMKAHSYGYIISGVFFGISCLILGYLLYKSELFPKWLGTLVVAAGFSYLIDCLTNFISPGYAGISEILVMSIAVISELSLCLFLLIKGVKGDLQSASSTVQE